jgi:O-methyltransferase involved in polyketide biosynthesis
VTNRDGLSVASPACPGGREPRVAPVAEFDPSVPSIARVYDYFLGGKDNFAADRALAEQQITFAPLIPVLARENRQFLARTAAWAANQGIDQFIDLGCGMPTEPNTHGSAQAVNPAARVAYVDNDAVAVAHLQAVAAQGAPGVTVVAGDVADPDTILAAISPGLDPAAPTCLIMGLLLHFYDPGTAHSLLARYCAALAPGSYLVVSMAHGNGEEGERWFSAYSSGPARARNYSVAEITGLFDGTELVAPGVVDARQWQPGTSDPPELPFRTGQAICGVGRIG